MEEHMDGGIPGSICESIPGRIRGEFFVEKLSGSPGENHGGVTSEILQGATSMFSGRNHGGTFSETL